MKPILDNPIRFIEQRRVALTLILAGAVILATPAFMERDTDRPRSLLIDEKLSWSACADCVLAGDSRVGNGLSPADLAAPSTGRRIYNFGFRACGYDACYLDAVERVLDPAGRNPSIVLGVTPRSLTKRLTRTNDFTLNVDEPRPRNRCLEKFYWLFDRVPLNRALAPLWPDWAPPKSQITLHPNGWSACVMTPEMPEIGLESYRRNFSETDVDPAMIAGVLEHVREWTNRGIAVYAFRPPTTAAMVALENELSGFDETAFVEAFIEAGGVWLIVDQTGYRSYDSAHLHRDAARQLSRDMGRAILEAETHRGESRIIVHCGCNPALVINAR